MAAKNELIARLSQLSAEVGRELETSGSTADLELRIREAEDELAALADVDSPDEGGGTGNEPSEESGNGQEEEEAEAGEGTELPAEVRVRALRTVSLTVRGKNGAWRAEIVRTGSEVTLQQHNYARLPAGLVSKIP